MDWCLWLYRELYWCRRAFLKRFCPTEEPREKIGVHIDSLPWLWIGNCQSNENTITVTAVVNYAVEYGDHVTPEYLSNLCGFRNGTWRYVDAKTLEDKEFPSEGFVIEDVHGKSVSDTE